MDYGGGQAGDQVNNLGMSIDGLNSTIGSLQQSIASFSQSMARNTTMNSGTALGGGAGFIGNAASAANMVLPPQVSEISPGMFYQQPAGMIHNALASMGVVGGAGGPMGMRQSAVEYQQGAWSNFTNQAKGAAAGAGESLLGGGLNNFFSMAGAASTWSGNAAGISVGMPAFLGGMALDAGVSHFTGAGLGEHASRMSGIYDYNRNQEARGIVAQSGLVTTPGRQLQGYEISSYGKAVKDTVSEVSDELGYKNTWLGGTAKRMDESEMLSAIESTGLLGKMAGTKNGRLPEKVSEMQALLKDSLNEVVKLSEALGVSQEDALKQLDKIASFSAKKTFKNPAEMVKGYFGQVYSAASAMDIAPVQAMDYMSNMQNMYSTTGLLNENAWGKIGIQSMVSGGAMWKTGQVETKEQGLNQAANVLSKVASSFAGSGLGEEIVTNTYAAMGEKGVARVRGFMDENKGLMQSDPLKFKENMKEFFAADLTPENMAAGAALGGRNSDSRNAINAMVDSQPMMRSMMHSKEQEVFAQMNTNDIMTAGLQTYKGMLDRNHSNWSEERRQQQSYVDYGAAIGVDPSDLYAMDNPTTRAERDKQNKIGAITANMRLNNTMVTANAAWWGSTTKAASSYVSDDYIKNVMTSESMTAGFREGTQSILASGADIGQSMVANERALVNFENSTGVAIKGLRDTGYNIKEKMLQIGTEAAGMSGFATGAVTGQTGDWAESIGFNGIGGSSNPRQSQAHSYAIMGEAASLRGKAQNATMDDMAALAARYAPEGGDAGTALNRLKWNESSVLAGQEAFDANGADLYKSAYAQAEAMNKQGTLAGYLTAMGEDVTKVGKDEILGIGAGNIMAAGSNEQMQSLLKMSMASDQTRFLANNNLNFDNIFAGDGEGKARAALNIGDMGALKGIMVGDEGNSVTQSLDSLGALKYANSDTKATAAMARMMDIGVSGTAGPEADQVKNMLSSTDAFRAQMNSTVGEAVTTKIMNSSQYNDAMSNGQMDMEELSNVLKSHVERTVTDMSPDKALADSTAASETDTKTQQAASAIQDAFRYLAEMLKGLQSGQNK